MIDLHRLNHNPQHVPEFSVILTKRSENPNDRHSGQLCYPGGKLEDNENDYYAALRKTNDEIGFDLEQNTFSLGRLPQNFLAYYTDYGKQLKMAVNVFFSPKEIILDQLILNQQHVSKVMFLPLNSLENCKIQVFNELRQPYNSLAQAGVSQDNIKLILNNQDSTLFHDLENERFYGISWLILMKLFQSMNYKNDPLLTRLIQQTKDAYKLQLKDESDLKSRIVSMIYDKQRLDQFFD